MPAAPGPPAPATTANNRPPPEPESSATSASNGTSQLVLRNVSRGYAGRPVLEGVDLSVAPGERVCVVGENGAGKSTLLRLMAGREKPDRGEVVLHAPGGVGYLGQIPDFPPGGSVQDALDDALADLRELERRLHAAEQALAAASEAELPPLLAAYGDLLDAFQARDGYAADARFDAAVQALGLAHVPRDRPLGSLSGGEQSRLALACVLAASPELLLLDEPTNHLDRGALDWLEARLVDHRGTVVAVSHDRLFLERVATALVEVDGDRRTVRRHGVGYPEYLQARAAARRRWEREYRDFTAEAERLGALAEQATAALTGAARPDRGSGHTPGRHQRSVQGQLSSRVRAANERLRRLREHPVPPPPRPLRFTARLPTAGAAPLPGGGPGGPGRSDGSGRPGGPGSSGAAPGLDGEPLVTLRAVAVGDRLRVEELEIAPGERLLVTGPNGAGKTTLLRVLAGDLAPDRGSVRGPGPEHIGWLPQEVPASPAPRRTLLAAFAEGLPGEPEEHRQTLLSLGLFRAEDLATPVGGLSAGQRRRLALARMVENRADLLLLDEPTNHLSPALVEDLEEALGSYQGALVVVSHDRLWVDRFTGRRCAMSGGRLREASTG
ncbi:ABC-F family ATP-binding cassette domain-containing protein [Allostreptomyces psammosilenae]|uniref:Macrolide transport system ATP-binding/permease protein n=1 Tax=Allostreptomyces psammosilenae TaxID=1892865 RepID=A0A853A4L9_9ACTN|nr:ABC-F family ATP-binding cassette domain-containing protein [Allostreptomyces psammosilenae]NYI07824.1 macrolide transport system ATP-binding/permease protein [Allostreptomyces psammosilenae]